MDTRIVFATRNQNKIKEVNRILAELYPPPEGLPEIIGLADIDCHEEIPETSDTIEGNAIQKATYVFEYYANNCFAEDTGLLVDVLDGRPGVFSARYAGEERNATKNMELLLSELAPYERPKARFLTVIALIIDGGLHTFEGCVKGTIVQEPRGDQGFGYDPIFLADGQQKTFGQMNLEDKNQISHRSLALSKMIKYLEAFSNK